MKEDKEVIEHTDSFTPDGIGWLPFAIERVQ
jgi:hypothetical protein